jgi:hypothetical protein
MSARTYRFHSVLTLRDIARDHWSVLAKLREIEAELATRTSIQAGEVRQQVADRIAELDPGHRRSAAFGRSGATATGAGLEREVEALRARLAEAEAELQQLRAAGPKPVYRTLGLDEDAPDFLIRAARTAWRKACHPDVSATADKADAQRRFIAAEAAFDTVYDLRGMSR